MAEELLFLMVVAAVVWALVELFQADKSTVRALPKALWVPVIVFLAPFGPAFWFLFGRPRAGVAAPATTRSSGGNPLRTRQTYVARPAPDDDPEFLAALNARADQQRRLRRLEEDFGAPDGPETDTDRPEDRRP